MVVLSNAGHSSFAVICPVFDMLSSMLGEDTVYQIFGGGEMYNQSLVIMQLPFSVRCYCSTMMRGIRL